MKKPCRIHSILLSVGTIISASVFAQNERGAEEAHTVTATDLRNKTMVVIGELGLPLGTPVEIEAIVTEEISALTPETTGFFLLKVEKVSGKELKVPPMIRFKVQTWSDATVAMNTFMLEKLLQELQEPRGGNFVLLNPVFPAKPLTEAEAKSFKDSYVGSRHKLVVYEAAEFDGMPMELPADCMPWKYRGFGFMSYLVVMAERKL